jgi:hypothetical protein
MLRASAKPLAAARARADLARYGRRRMSLPLPRAATADGYRRVERTPPLSERRLATIGARVAAGGVA